MGWCRQARQRASERAVLGLLSCLHREGSRLRPTAATMLLILLLQCCCIWCPPADSTTSTPSPPQPVLTQACPATRTGCGCLRTSLAMELWRGCASSLMRSPVSAMAPGALVFQGVG